MRQELKQMSLKEKQFADMLEDPELQPLLQKKLAQLLTTENIQEVLEGIIFTTLSNEGVLRDIEMMKLYTGIDSKTHCVGADWDWDDMSAFERKMYPEKQKIIVQPLQAQLIQIQERIEDVSVPVLHEKETIFISANETEVRARLLVEEKLISVQRRNERRYMLGPEVQKYLLHEIPEEHRATEKSVRQASIEVMKKALELFPNKVRVGKNKQKRNFIEYIENLYDQTM